MKLKLAGQEFEVKERSLWWRTASAVIIANPYLKDLFQLKQLMVESNLDSLIVLGHLVHPHDVRNPHLNKIFIEWRQQNQFEIVQIEGTYDRRVSFPAAWKILREEKLDWYNLSFRCNWDASAPYFQLTGHFSPVLNLSLGAHVQRLPCFWRRENGLILPAFAETPHHYNIELGRHESAILVTPEGPVPFP